MKQRIPPDVERLMWLVAENNDPQAIADFEARFPDLRYELAQRRRMVSDLKGAKAGHQQGVVPIPAFSPRQTVRAASSKQVWVAAGLGLAALAVASYSLTVWINTPSVKPPTVPTVQTGPVEPRNDVQYNDSPSTTGGPQTHREVQTPPIQTPEVTPPAGPAGEQPKTVKLSNTSLVAALKMVGAEGGYNVEVAPGFHDQKVSLDYENVTTSSILKDLGLRYGFTAFNQGDGTIIVVPAIADGPSAAPNDPNGPSRHIGG